jgi:hypothetical protein
MAWGVQEGRGQLQATCPAGGYPYNSFKAVSGVAACRAYKGRAWLVLAILKGVHGHPLPYTHVLKHSFIQSKTWRCPWCIFWLVVTGCDFTQNWYRNLLADCLKFSIWCYKIFNFLATLGVSNVAFEHYRSLRGHRWPPTMYGGMKKQIGNYHRNSTSKPYLFWLFWDLG